MSLRFPLIHFTSTQNNISYMIKLWLDNRILRSQELIMSSLSEHFFRRGFWLPNCIYCIVRLVVMETRERRYRGYRGSFPTKSLLISEPRLPMPVKINARSHATLQSPLYPQTPLSHSFCLHASLSDLLGAEGEDSLTQKSVVLFKIINQVRLLFYHFLQTGAVPKKWHVHLFFICLEMYVWSTERLQVIQEYAIEHWIYKLHF